jgi:DNA topoisomerase-1
MRTDGIDMAPEAIADIRTMIGVNYGKQYVPASPRVYQNKSKNAQEAHEAVRPTGAARTPAQVAKYVDRDQARLYELIWNRAVASQMEGAEMERTTVDITAKSGSRTIDLRATGQVVKFDGFLTLYQEGQDETSDDEESRRLPAMSQDEVLSKQVIESAQHFTEPPPRFSEAALVKRMEELGIGRPSTYASILQVLQDRGYVRIDKKRLMPEDKGRVVVGFLESFFSRYVEYDFTASLEEKLDRISNGEIEWRSVLAEFWQGFIGSVNDIRELRITQVLDALNELLGPHIFPARADGGAPRQCPTCGTGQLSLKVGRFGAFIGCSNYPECRFTRQMTPGAGGVQSTKMLGEDPATGLEVSLRGGRFGPYLQLGEQAPPEKKVKGVKAAPVEKPKRASLPKGVAPEDIDLEKALALLALPREVGLSPEDNQPILAGVGRFGPYVKHGKVYASLEEGDDVLTVGLNRAVTLIAEKIANPKKGRRFGADPGRSLGDHPDKGGAVVVKSGRYGPYVSNNGINATITGDKTPETITLTEAIVLLDARAEQLGSQPRRAAGRKKAGAPATPKARNAKVAAEPGAATPPKARKTSAKKPAKTKAAKKAEKITAAE